MRNPTCTGLLLLLLPLPSCTEEPAPVGEPASVEGLPATQVPATPTWVHDPASYYDPPREDVLLAVGRSEVRGSEAMARATAETDARLRLMEAYGRGTFEMNAQRSGGQAVVQTRIQGTMGGVRILAYWTSPDGWLHALGQLDLR